VEAGEKGGGQGVEREGMSPLFESPEAVGHLIFKKGRK